MGRQERRVQLKKAMAEVSRRGMDVAANASEQSWAVFAAARILIDILNGRAPGRAAKAAKAAHDFFEVSLNNSPAKHPIACAKGCTWCCHVSVTARAPEIFLMANRIRELPKDQYEDVLNRVRAADQRTRHMSGQERARQKVPCAMLKDGGCSVYDARPGACRGFVSVSADACRRGYDGEPTQIVTPSTWTKLRDAHKQALWAAIAAAGRPADSYELHHALRIALELPDAESRWLSGEDVFAAVARATIEDPAVSANNKRIIDQIIAGAMGQELAG